MTMGVKSKSFGCIWKTMFIHSLCYPYNPTRNDVFLYKNFYKYIVRTLPCKFCREFSINVLEKLYPIDYSNRKTLFKSLYIWKDIVNKKLLAQGDTKTKPSPPIKVVWNRYTKLYAKCDAQKQQCI